MGKDLDLFIDSLKVNYDRECYAYNTEFEWNGKTYLADICEAYECNECVICEVDNGKVNTKGVYINKHVKVVPEDLLKCVKEFIESLND